MANSGDGFPSDRPFSHHATNPSKGPMTGGPPLSSDNVSTSERISYRRGRSSRWTGRSRTLTPWIMSNLPAEPYRYRVRPASRTLGGCCTKDDVGPVFRNTHARADPAQPG